MFLSIARRGPQPKRRGFEMSSLGSFPAALPQPMQRAKRLADFVGSAVLLALFSPVMAGIAVVIRLNDGSPVLFRQHRPGLNGAVFAMYKFRTMRPPQSGQSMYTTDALRVTRAGAFLRKSSLDELPELWNVLKGDMSLVGPRPLLVEYLPRYSPRHRLRHCVRPGITGLAQVSGRRSLTFSERLDLDVRYVEEWSPALDVKILLKTLAVSLRKGSDETQLLESVDDLGLLTREVPSDS